MIPIFLQSVPGNIGTAEIAAIGAAIVFIIILSIVMYIYFSFAYMAIARKAKYPSPGIAWIPAVGPALITSKTAKMHWWPILLLIGTVIPFISFIFGIAFAVFSIIWHWKTFETIGKPGWWAIMMIIPVVNLIFLGIAAWSKK